MALSASYSHRTKRYKSGNIVAHNESFDRGVLKSSMELYNLNYSELSLPEKWDCTMKIYRQKGFAKANLSYCCNIMNIELNHHEALSDARACALLFLKK
ncbi:MAG: exonuclease domain-containing protein [Bacteroidales bacterium]